jgi:hypothetical protein
MRKKILLIAAALFASANSAYAETTWYGLMTVDKIPIDRCVVTDFLSVRESNWISGGSPEQTQDFLDQFEAKFSGNVKRDGYNAVLGFRVNSIRSGAGVLSSPFGTVIQLTGVAVKITCK